MDLAICPACKQSVLDDDATICPFCGAAMDGSSGPVKGPSKPTSVKHPKAASSAKEAVARPAAVSPKPAAPAVEEDPFAVAPRKQPKAFPLQRKPTAKTSYRVVCPMCDTNGFATPAVAGKEVRCPNPKCLMPIFTAPEIKKEAPAPEKKSLQLPAVLAMILVGLLAAGGGAYYVFVLNPAAPTPEPYTPPVVNQNEQIDAPDTPVNPPVQEPVVEQVPLSTLVPQILNSGIEAARQRGANNRSKEFCRVLTAEAFAVQGQIENALAQLQAFDNLGSGLDFMKITPLSRIAWFHLKNGDRAAAEKVADQAAGYTAKLPRNGADAVQQAVVLGTLLIALERYDAAQELIESRETIQDIAQSAARVSMVIEDHSYDLAASYRWLPRVELISPLAFAATYGATVQGYENQALQWIQGLESSERKNMCIAAYAAGLAMKAETGEKSFSEQSLSVFAELSDVHKQRAMALALQVLQMRDAKTAEAIRQQILSAIANWAPPGGVNLPDMRGIYEGNFQLASADNTTAVQTHLIMSKALAEAGQTAEAWQQIEKALQWLPSKAPNKGTVQPLADQVDRNRPQIQEQLASLLSITRDDLKPAAFNQYRKNVRQIEEQAQQRYDMESRVLNLAMDFGLAVPLYQAYQQQPVDSNFRKIVEGDMIADLVFLLNSKGETTAARELTNQWPDLAGAKSPRQAQQQLENLIDAGHAVEAHEFLRSADAGLNVPLQSVRFTSQLAETKSPEVVVAWVNSISDVLERELSYRFGAAILTQRNLIRETWKTANLRNLSATEKCSLNLGLMEGLGEQQAVVNSAPAATSAN